VIHRWIAAACLFAVASDSCVTCAHEKSEPAQKSASVSKVGKLVGQLADTRGHIVHGGQAAVFLCDAATGMPINRETKEAFNPLGELRAEDENALDKLWFDVISEKGVFEFSDVPVGRYRLVAQSWSGTEGFPGFDANNRPSAFLVLHGVAENVEVKAGERAVAYPRQLGHHVLRIVNDPEEPHALLVISQKPTLGDGILGPWGWGKDFCRHWIGMTQMEVPHVTIVGLPKDTAVHVGLVNYDNIRGVGAGSYEPGQREGRLRIIAGWSNGHKDPPPELVKLTDHLEQNKIAVANFLDDTMTLQFQHLFQADDDAHRALFRVLVEDNERMVDVPDFGEQRLADVLAAYGYIDMRKRKR